MKMRVLYSVIILLVLFVSCSKNNSNTAPVTCLINDTAYSFTSGLIKNDSGDYWLYATDNSQNDILLLTPYPYTGSANSVGSSSAYIKLIHYKDSTYSYNVTVAISGIHDSLVDGTFAGYMQQVRPAGSQTIKITNGVFKNVPVQQ